MNKANTCNLFENKRETSSTEMFNGFLIRKDQVEDYRTEIQWNDAGYKVKKGSIGHEMYASRYAANSDGKRFLYYLPEQVERIRALEGEENE